MEAGDTEAKATVITLQKSARTAKFQTLLCIKEGFITVLCIVAEIVRLFFGRV